jgi:hypothetical protein
MAGNLYCGAGKGDYTPDIKMLPVRIKMPGESPELSVVGIISHTYVRAILISDGTTKVVFISYEMPNFPAGEDYGMAEAISLASNTLNIPEANIIVLATNSHSVPGVGTFTPERSQEEIAFNDYYREHVNNATLAAIKEAERSLQLAKVGIARGNSFINVNGDQTFSMENRTRDTTQLGINFEGYSDKTLFALRFEDNDGKTIALIVNYAVKSIVMIGNTVFKDGVGISPDIAGAVSALLEEQNPGAVALWALGLSGDQWPLYTTTMFIPNPENGERMPVKLSDGPDILRILSAYHFDDIIRTLAKIDHYDNKLEMETALEWANIPARIVIHEDPKNWPSPVKEIITDGVPDITIRFQLLRLGDIAFIGVSGELYSSVTQVIRKASPLNNTCILSKCGYRPKVNYFPNDAALIKGGHGSYYSESEPLEPGLSEKIFTETVKKLFCYIREVKQ